MTFAGKTHKWFLPELCAQPAQPTEAGYDALGAMKKTDFVSRIFLNVSFYFVNMITTTFHLILKPINRGTHIDLNALKCFLFKIIFFVDFAQSKGDLGIIS